MESTDSQSPEQASGLSPCPGHGTRWVFFGPHGLRAGWSMLVFAAVLVGMGFAIREIFAHLVYLPSGPPPPWLDILNEAIQLCLVLVATFVMSRIERESLLAYGFQGKARAIRFLSGLVWGFITLSVLVLSLWKLGYLTFNGVALGGEASLRYAAEWGVIFLLVGFFEESIMRGYLQFTFTRGLGFWWGALIMSFLFGFGHGLNPGESPVGLVSASAFGLVFCLSLWYTGSLWWAIGFHAAWDWAESYIYGAADSGTVARGHLLREHPVGPLLGSGGVTGPEGSLLILPLIAIMALIMYLWWGRRTDSPFIGSAWHPFRLIHSRHPM